ncbi:APC family permease [Sulfolobus sp. A20-N-F6]|nr:APC family permease [Sulfolobus sp. A20-N-F6]
MDSLSKKLEPKEGSLPRYLIYAQSLASIAPLGSASAYLTYAFYSSYASTFIAGILGSLIYFIWVLIGYRYSKIIATTGGIYDFARSASGEMLGKIAGWLYWISYAIYLPSATTYLVGIVIPFEFSFNIVYLSILEIAIPIILTLLLITGIKPPLFYALITSTLEVILIVVLGIKVLSITGLSVKPLHVSVGLSSLMAGALGVGFTLAGGGASFFLGYEAVGKGRSVGLAYIIAYCVASFAVLFASYYEIAFAGFTNTGVASLLNATSYPGFYISQKVMGNTFALIFFIFTINSLIGSVTAAYVALSRLTYTLVKKDMLLSIIIVASFFLGVNLIGSVTRQFYNLYNVTTTISLVTLYTSHIIVSGGYPLFAKKNYKLKIYDILLGILAVLLMGYGIYEEITSYFLISILSILAGVIIAVVHNQIRLERFK